MRILELSFNKKSDTSITWNNLKTLDLGIIPGNNDEGKSNYSLFIDDLHALELLAPSQGEARIFISNTLSSITTSSTITSLVGFGRCANMDDDQLSLTEYCSYRADVTVEVKQLSTGYSLDTHGLIQISSRHMPNNSDTSVDSSTSKLHGLWFQTLLFKALETGVKCSIVRQKV